MHRVKTKKIAKFRFPILLLNIALFIGGAYLGIYAWNSIKPIEIMEIRDTLSYGEVSLSGIIQKDFSLNTDGNYFLTLPEGEVILLDTSSGDPYIGLTVLVSGNLNPPEGISSLPLMSVSNIQTINKPL